MPIALVRNASLIAFGLGLTLVVASSVSDWIRRRDEPAHVQPVD